MNSTLSRAEVVTAPVLEPLTLEEAKTQVYVSGSDHDDELLRLIQVAREQWEHDTDSAVLTQTLKVTSYNFYDHSLYLPKRPVQSITSITYYDSAGNLNTLSTDVYSLDKQARAVRLKVNQTWPVVETVRWDAISITYVAGETTRAAVPAIAKQAMLLLVNYYFEANKGDNDRQNDMRAYERLVARFMRTSYP